MRNSNIYYTNNLGTYKKEVSKIYKQLSGLSTARLLVFVVTIIGVYFTYNKWQLAAGIGLVGIISFLYLLVKYTTLKAKYNFTKALVVINEEELKIASGDFHYKKEGLQFQDPNHNYALDIDLFGRGSFFQFIDRTSISEGTKDLVHSLLANNISNIPERQDAIKELAIKPDWRQRYQAKASLIKVETKATHIVKWLQTQQSFIPKLMRWMPNVFSIGSLIVFTFVFTGMLSGLYLAWWLLIGLLTTGVFLKKTNSLANQTDKIRDTFRQYAQLLEAIETETFTATLLLKKQEQIQLKNKKASAILNELSKAMDGLDNRNNLISAIFGNGLFLTDLRNTFAIEQWIENYKHTVEEWFKVVSFFDAYNSLANYAFNHEHYIYPEILNQNTKTKVSQLGHPLLKQDKRIDNDFEIDNQQFFIITGANMAGKSTFLRTVSLHIVMANVGLPVCAKTSRYSPIKLITSMRTSDSLADESSYFFSELTRLKYIVDAIKDDSYFIILDEILKGTNSTDKAIGSRKFVEKLVATNATGIIATHDLSLCDIEKELEEVKNYYFDAQIINDELYFDYSFKKGICQNMNASFLLKKMEIV